MIYELTHMEMQHLLLVLTEMKTGDGPLFEEEIDQAIEILTATLDKGPTNE